MDTPGYDQAHRLASASVAGAASSYAYDGDGKRASQTVGGVTTQYVSDVAGGLPVLLDDGTRKYVWGAGGLAYSVETASGVVEVSHADGLGTVRASSDSVGGVVRSTFTDEFGVPLLRQGSGSQPFGYTGEQTDSTGLVYLRARMYDPAVGRFIQRDPFPGVITAPLTLHRFSYVENNPPNLVDPSGLKARVLSTDGDDTPTSPGRVFVGTPSGHLVPVRDDWKSRPSDTRGGIVHQRSGAAGNADMVRIMPPGADSRYPSGYVQYTNSLGQPLDVQGRPGPRAATHIHINTAGGVPGYYRGGYAGASGVNSGLASWFDNR